MDALIGHSGFVGQTLLRQRDFAARFNTSNIAQSAGQSFDLTVCAAAPGSMFEANRFPERDALAIDELCARLDRITAKQFVLISTIAVLDRFDSGADETTDAFQQTLAYGTNRRRLEAFCQHRFDSCLILRLPALFGAGLKKNFLFDLKNPVPSMLPPARFDALLLALPNFAPLLADVYRADADLGMYVLDRNILQASGQRQQIDAAVQQAGYSALGFTNPASRFQFYQMSRLWADISLALAANLPVLHLAPEPIAAGAVHLALTGRAMPENTARLHAEDMRTAYAGLWARQGPYMSSAAEVMAALQDFAIAP